MSNLTVRITPTPFTESELTEVRRRNDLVQLIFQNRYLIDGGYDADFNYVFEFDVKGQINLEQLERNIASQIWGDWRVETEIKA